VSAFANLPQSHFGVILADPPWTWKAYSDKGLAKSPQRHYGCMSLDDIKALPVAGMAAPNAMCVMWATSPMMPQALATLAAWGFTFKTMGAWHKRSSTGAKDAFGTGYIFRSAAEFYIVGTRGHPKPAVKNVRNLITAPVREHSRKPDQMRSDLERMFPDANRIELFARQVAPGWTAWGNQVDRFDVASELEMAA